ncbi:MULTISPECIES: hypothetical protein [unclassified Caballeronia]|uniref:hypothetical protein n=1 Tax=unclassified Caballeronia TaxID=2646786 RepID=UPI002028BC6D|nr:MULTISPECIES: hypothetical protein [unclassified Caballeronia]
MAERRIRSAKTATAANDVAIPCEFTTEGFTALRAYVQRIAPEVIARTYYEPDADPPAATPAAMARYLTDMLDTLVALALAHGSTALTEHLRASIKQHGRPLLQMVERGIDVIVLKKSGCRRKYSIRSSAVNCPRHDRAARPQISSARASTTNGRAARRNCVCWTLVS